MPRMYDIHATPLHHPSASHRSRLLSLQHTIFAFLPVAGQVRDLNQHIFSTLHVFHPVTLSNILILHPPKEEVTLEFINHNGPIASGAYDTVISQSGDIVRPHLPFGPLVAVLR